MVDIGIKDKLVELMTALATTPYATGKWNADLADDVVNRVIEERRGYEKIELARFRLASALQEFANEISTDLGVSRSNGPRAIKIDPRDGPTKAIEQGVTVKGLHIGIAEKGAKPPNVSVNLLFQERTKMPQNDFTCFLAIAFTTRSSATKRYPQAQIEENARQLREQLEVGGADFPSSPFRRVDFGDYSLPIKSDYARSISLGYQINLSQLRNSGSSEVEDLLRFFLTTYEQKSIKNFPVSYPPLSGIAESEESQVYENRVESSVEETLALIHAGYPNIVLTGPPGTSKTITASNVAIALQQADGQSEYGTTDSLVPNRFISLQFHPAYSYEDFVQGWRPVETEEGSPPSFKMTPGALLMAVQSNITTLRKWRGLNPDYNPHTGSSNPLKALPKVVILLDEINRANIPRVFGEVFQLIEASKRCDCLPEERGSCVNAIQLAGSDDDPADRLVLPSNFVFIGTMNTSDRSVARLDDALRRRFAFIDLQPDESVLRQVWLKVLKDDPEAQVKAENIAVGFRNLNGSLRDPVFVNKKIGHANFMPTREEEGEGFSQDFLTRRWKYMVLPYLESVSDELSEETRRFARIDTWGFGHSN